MIKKYITYLLQKFSRQSNFIIIIFRNSSYHYIQKFYVHKLCTNNCTQTLLNHVLNSKKHL